MALVTLVVLGIVASLTVFWARLGLETRNNVVQLVMDYDDAREFTSATGYPLDEFLIKMSEVGVGSVGVGEARVSDLTDEGRAIVVPAVTVADKFLDNSLAPRLHEVLLRKGNADSKSFLILPKADWAVGFIKDLSTRLIGQKVTYEVVNDPEGARYVVSTSVSAAKLSRQHFGLDRNQIVGIRDLGLGIVPRYGNFRGNSPASIGTMLGQLDWVGQPSLIIFEGRDILGYGKYLKTTASLMERQGFSLGLIELARQRGEETVATALDFSALRVHSVSKSEMKVLKPNVVVERYIRAVRERGMRVLYLRPFPERDSAVRLVSVNRDYVATLAKELRASGYTLGTAQPYRRISAPMWVLILAALGASAAAALVLWHLLGVSPALRLAVALGGTAVFVLLMAVGRGILARQMMALVAAIALPSLAVLSQYIAARRGAGTADSVAKSARMAFLLLVRASVVSALGGVLVVGLLGDTRFVLKLSQFVGVKLMHIAPILVVAWVAMGVKDKFRKGQDVVRYLRGLYMESLPVRYLVWLGLAGLLGLVYLSRTGNQSSIPVLGVERAFRSFLEHVLVARPRTKEFLFGHPLLMLGFALAVGNYRKAAIPAIILGTIGQASIVDTHAHIHSPLIISTLRWVYSVIIGGALGVGVLYAVDLLLKRQFHSPEGITEAPAHLGRARAKGARRV